MSTSTQSSIYSNTTPSYSSNTLTQVHATFTTPAYNDLDRTEVAEHLLHSLTPKLLPFMDILRDYDVANGTYSYHGRLTVAPLSIKQTIRNNLYILNTMSFTEAEINAALRYTYPERFV